MTTLLADHTVVDVHRDFAAAQLTPADWSRVAARGPTRTVFQEWHWVDAWWHSFGRGELAVVTAREQGELRAIAPFFIDGGMAYLVGSGGSDYLDIIGDVGTAESMAALLRPVLDAHPHLLGIVLYLVPDASPTGALVSAAARLLGLRCIDEGALVAPAMSLPDAAAVLRATGKKSLVRHERKLGTQGALRVLHLHRTAEIVPWLETFFDQHHRRWLGTPYPSLFDDAAQRSFYRRLVASADECGWVRFTVLLSEARPVAFHFGFAHASRFLWYKPAFEIELAPFSPGEVLLRNLILEASAEHATTFDFGLGDEGFKRRFADQYPLVRTWGLHKDGAA